MHDPVFSAITAARVGLLWSAPDVGRALAQWPLIEVRGLREGIAVIDGKLRYDRDTVKSLTFEELRTRLVDLVNPIRLTPALRREIWSVV